MKPFLDVKGKWAYRNIMKMTILAVIMVHCLIESVTGQVYDVAQFSPVNFTAPTRLYSADGPFAGPDILGQYLGGAMADDLVPLGAPQPHLADFGHVFGAVFTVPNVGCRQTAMIQLAVWDQTLWGASYESVPLEQIGRTDVVPVRLSCGTDPLFSSEFTQAAIAPIPEPGSALLGLIGIGALGWGACVKG